MGIAGLSLERGEFLEAFYVWVRAWVFSGREGARLVGAGDGNILLGVGGEKLRVWLEMFLRVRNFRLWEWVVVGGILHVRYLQLAQSCSRYPQQAFHFSDVPHSELKHTRNAVE